MVNTIPPTSSQEHISNLINSLRKNLPEVNEEMSVFFDDANGNMTTRNADGQNYSLGYACPELVEGTPKTA